MANAKQKIVITSLVSAIVGGTLVAGGGYVYLNGTNTGVTTSTKTVVAPKVVSGNSDATKVYNNVKEAVVSVLNEQTGTGTQSIFGTQSSDSSSDDAQLAGSGSGVIYKISNGDAYLVTNNHVVEGANKLQVVLFSGKTVDAKLVGTDPMTDLAVLKISDADVKGVAQFGDSKQVKVGQTVLAIGSPLGTEYASSLTQGIISATDRLVTNQDEAGNNYGEAVALQTDTAINPGNSGGPLVNMAGQVIGINSQKLSQTQEGTSVEGMGFAIPSDTVVEIANRLVKDGEVVRPAIGVSLVELSSVDSAQRKSVLKIPTSVTQGVVVAAFSKNSAAEKAGIKKYDVITKIDGVKVSSTAEARAQVFKHVLGDTVKVTYYHQDKEKTVSLKMTEKLELNTTSK
ncbi:MAG: trypsin-like peptidase domain-containing protein [Lactobacillaceae bacterium]|jgi:serine protease Do|nr:trypsin-like peptidase domain-containing protein [Lactobacillaceae bacterium]